MVLHAVLIAASFAQPNPNWEAGVAPSYVRGGGFDGPGIAVQFLWSPNDYLALGPMVDVARVSAGLTDGNGIPASYAFTSTFAAGMAQFRLPLRPIEPYAGLALGYVDVSGRRSVNTACGVTRGLGGLLAIGGRAALSDHLTVGLRGSARSSSFEQNCAAEAARGGSPSWPASFELPWLFALSSTFDYRW
jgi:hypothetical protein